MKTFKQFQEGLAANVVRTVAAGTLGLMGLDTIKKMNKIDMKIKYYDVMLKFLEEIIRVVSNRTYQIKNAIEWNKFQAGYN